MSFLYPLGFLGLIGLAVILAIYLIKTKYKEQTIASTYIWNLSEKFLKKRKPLKKIDHLLPLILQLLVVFFLTVALVNPTFAMDEKADNVCFVLDASGSMNMQYRKTTRFETAKEKICDMIQTSYTGGSYTLVLSGSEPRIVFEKESDKSYMLGLIGDLEAEQCASDVDEALELVQDFYEENQITKIYLLSDRVYEETSKIEVLNFADEALNFSITGSRYTVKNDLLRLSVDLIAYGENAVAELTVRIDDREWIRDEISLIKDVEENVQYEFPSEDFDRIAVKIENEDLLLLDNEEILYNLEKADRSDVLLVSSAPFYLQSIFQAIGCRITVIDPQNYENQEDYDIYVFDSFTPERLPLKGAVWLINTDRNVPDSGFVVQDDIALDDGGVMTYANEDSDLYEKLTKNIKNNSVSFNRYMKYGVYRTFTTVLSYQRSPLIFAGYNDIGNREIVFAFDFHNSDFPLLYDYIVLMINFVNYSFPQTVESNYYTVGDEMKIHWVEDYDYIKITAPSGKIAYLDQTLRESDFLLKEVGSYFIETSFEGKTKGYHVYSHFDERESNSLTRVDSLKFLLDADHKKVTAFYDKISVYMLILLAFLLIDWGLYVYEKH